MTNKNQFKPFHYKTLNDLEETIKALCLDIPINRKVNVLQHNIKIGRLIAPNRLAIQPMEGFDAKGDGSPGELTLRRYDRYARGGAGLIWFEATAISENGRSNPHQLMLNEDNLSRFRQLVKNTRDTCNETLEELGFKDECILILQLNHSGRYSKNSSGVKFPIRAYHNSELDDAIKVSKSDGLVLNDNELENLEDIWVEKATLAKDAGFDGVDIKSCHGYLINGLLNSRIKEDSKYRGKSLEKREKFLLNIIKRLVNNVKNDKKFIITTRFGIYDGIPYPNGFGVKNVENESFPASVDLSEPIELIKKLNKLGVKMINLSMGNPRFNPHLTRPYDTPLKSHKAPPEHPLISIDRIIKLTSLIKKQIPKEMIVVSSGHSYLRAFAGYIAAGMINQHISDICGFGRMAFANPEFPRQIFQNGIINKKKVCITCSKCSELMKLGKNTGCVVRDSLYKNMS